MKNLEIDNIASHQLHDSLLLFRSAEQIFAVPALAVQEILYPLPVTPLPFVSHAIEGLINVEGRIAVQLCLAKLNHLPAPSAHPELVLLDTGRARCALHVDAVI
jgi:chemotaxis signal transduction protein